MPGCGVLRMPSGSSMPNLELSSEPASHSQRVGGEPIELVLDFLKKNRYWTYTSDAGDLVGDRATAGRSAAGGGARC